MNNELFEKARAVYGTGAYDDATLEFLFPELTESEDERIRRCLLAHFSRYQPEEIFLHSITMGDIVAYLEKQK